PPPRATTSGREGRAALRAARPSPRARRRARAATGWRSRACRRECSRAVAETMQTLPTTRALLRPAVRARRDGAPHRERWPVWRRDRRNGSAINGGSSAATRGPTSLASYRRTAGEVNAPDRCTVPPRATRLVAKVPAEARGMATALNVPGFIG